jgi:hypothetical protein
MNTVIKSYKVILLALVLFSTSSQLCADDFRWKSLKAAEQTILKPYQQRWDQLTPIRRERLSHGARLKSLSNNVQDRIKIKHKWFKKLSPDQQKELRKRWGSLSKEERRKMRKSLSKAVRKQRSQAVDKILE